MRMKLENSLEFDPKAESEPFFEQFEHRAAVFALFPEKGEASGASPYIGRTHDLQRRLRRVLRKPEANSKLLNLREITRRVEYAYDGSGFEKTSLVYRMTRHYHTRPYHPRVHHPTPTLRNVNVY